MKKIILAAGAVFLVGARFAAEPAPAIRIQAAANQASVFTAADFKTLARRKARATDHDGRKSTFEGWNLGDVLGLAGVPRGKELRGAGLAKYVVVSAPDGYRVVFALAELDPAFTDKVVLLADRRDGAPLGASEGPFRVVVPDEKRPARWIRQAETFEVRTASGTEDAR